MQPRRHEGPLEYQDGVVQIVDRQKLLNGPKEPTRENLLYPQVGRLDLPPNVGAHTAFPMIGVEIAEFAKDKDGRLRDFVVVTDESIANECLEARQMVWIADITTESKPFGVSSWTVPESSGDFCGRGGRFGTHSSNENFTSIYYKRVMFFALQRRCARRRRARSVSSEGNRVVRPGDHRQDRQALRRRTLQGGDSDQQRRRRRSRVHLHRRPREHRAPYPRAHRQGA